MDESSFGYLSEFVRRRSGVVLAREKPYLIEGRLAPVARRFGFRDAACLMKELRHAREPLARAVIEALTTNDSS
ncbi:MAG: chemotaxis protein CheR, partial [Alphaproteobacteria bacterium]|nr:chemotaxis protein CheR [Alphaproteobacteria bacterium]